MAILSSWSQYKADLTKPNLGTLRATSLLHSPSLVWSELARSQRQTQLSKKGAIVKKVVIDLYHHGTADTANDIAAPPNPTSLIPHGSLEPVGNETRMVKRY
jgi:hypothetical protein